MSATDGNSGDSHAHDAHDAPHDAHAHGPPPPPEPHTPMWLPAVGAVLFLTVGLVWGLSSPPASATDGTSTSATTTATAPATASAVPAGSAAPAGSAGRRPIGELLDGGLGNLAPTLRGPAPRGANSAH